MQNNNQNQQATGTQQIDPGFQSLRFKVEGYLKLIFLLTSNLQLPFPFWKTLNLLIAVIICCLGLTRQNGPLQLNKQYFISAIQKDFFQCYFYIIALLTLENPTSLFYFPLSIFFGMGTAYFLKYSKTIVQKYQFLQKYANTILTHRDDFKKGRAYVELFLFVYSLIMITKIGFMFPVMMFSYLRIRGTFERFSHISYITLRNEISQKCQGKKIGSIIDTLSKKFFNFLTNSHQQLIQEIQLLQKFKIQSKIKICAKNEQKIQNQNKFTPVLILFNQQKNYISMRLSNNCWNQEVYYQNEFQQKQYNFFKNICYVIKIIQN